MWRYCRPPLDTSGNPFLPHAERGLQQRDEARDEEHGGDDVGVVLIVLLEAHRRADEERHRQRGAKHRQVMLAAWQGAARARFNAIVTNLKIWPLPWI